MSIFKKLLGGGDSLIKDIGDVVDKFVTTKEEKEQMKIELLEVVNKEKDSARRMYVKDAWLQKVYGVVFLVGYIGVSILLIEFLRGSSDLTAQQSTFLTMIFTAMSMKVNTITDFLFGGSLSENSKKE